MKKLGSRIIMISVLALLTMVALNVQKNCYALGSYIEVYPTGDPATDVNNVQNAVNNYEVVLLKAGEFDFGLHDITIPGDAANHRVVIDKRVVLKGETSDGQMTTIRNGFFCIQVGYLNAPEGDVVIESIHFKNPGGCAIFVRRLSSHIMIKDNIITGDLWKDLYSEDGAGIKEAPPHPPTPGTFLAWKKAWTKLYYNPHPAVMEWIAFGILVGVSSAPGEVTGRVLVKNNYIDLEEEGLPMEPTKVWWHTFGLYELGTDAEVNFTKNTVRNCTTRGILILDTLGNTIVNGNSVELGPLGSYHLGFSTSAIGIVASYGFFDLYGEETPNVGGQVQILNNRVVCASVDKVGIRASGYGGKTLSSVNILKNYVTIEEGEIGIWIADVEGCTVLCNRIDGGADYGLMVGSIDASYPLNTDENTFVNNKISGFTPFSGFDAYFAPDTHSNVLIHFKGTVNDEGTDNIVR